MDYQRLLQMKEELEGIRSNFVSIDKSDYNELLKITEEDVVCIDTSKEVELDSDDLRNLVERCIKKYEKVSN